MGQLSPGDPQPRGLKHEKSSSEASLEPGLGLQEVGVPSTAQLERGIVPLQLSLGFPTSAAGYQQLPEATEAAQSRVLYLTKLWPST